MWSSITNGENCQTFSANCFSSDFKLLYCLEAMFTAFY
jgi:hypothetical protein